MNMQSNVCKAKMECGWGLRVNKVEMSYTMLAFPRSLNVVHHMKLK